MKTKDKVACVCAIALMIFIIFYLPNDDDDLINEHLDHPLVQSRSGIHWIIAETVGNRTYVLVNDVAHEAVKFNDEKISRIISEFESKKKVQVLKHTVELFPNEEGLFFKGVFLEHTPIATN